MSEIVVIVAVAGYLLIGLALGGLVSAPVLAEDRLMKDGQELEAGFAGLLTALLWGPLLLLYLPLTLMIALGGS